MNLRLLKPHINLNKLRKTFLLRMRTVGFVPHNFHSKCMRKESFIGQYVHE